MAVMPRGRWSFDTFTGTTYPEFRPPYAGADSGLQPGSKCITGAGIAQSIPVAFQSDTTKKRWVGSPRSAMLNSPIEARRADDCTKSATYFNLDPINQVTGALARPGEGDEEYWCMSYWWPTNFAGSGMIFEWGVKDTNKWPSYGMSFLDLGSTRFSGDPTHVRMIFHAGALGAGGDPAATSYNVEEYLLGPNAPKPWTKGVWHDFILYFKYGTNPDIEANGGGANPISYGTTRFRRTGKPVGIAIIYHRQEGQEAAGWTRLYSNDPTQPALINRPSHPTILWNNTWGAPGENGTLGLWFGNAGMYRNYVAGAPTVNYWYHGVARETSLTAAQAIFLPGGTQQVAPANDTRPTVTGTVQENQTLTGTAGSWTGTEPITYAYQWERSTDSSGAAYTAIGGATSTTYVLVSADVGRFVRLTVTASNGAGSSAASSTPAGSQLVTAAPAGGTNTVTPDSAANPTNPFAASGSFQVTIQNLDDRYLLFAFQGRGPLSATSPPTYAGLPMTKRYGATANSVTQEIWELVDPPVGTASLVWTAASTSPANVVIDAMPAYDVDPVTPLDGLVQQEIVQSGTLSERTITVAGSYAPAGALAIAFVTFNAASVTGPPAVKAGTTTVWAENRSSTQGAAAYLAGSGADKVLGFTPNGGANIDAALVAFAMKPSSAAVTIIPVNTAAPAITGTARRARTLTASTGTWTGSPSSYAYQWYRVTADPVVEGEVPTSTTTLIAGATASTYLVAEADVGSTLVVAVTASTTAGSSIPAVSEPTGTVDGRMTVTRVAVGTRVAGTKDPLVLGGGI